MPNEANFSLKRLGMMRALTAVVLAILVVSMGGPLLLGQPLFRSVESVETMVASASIVVVARVSRFDPDNGIRISGFRLGFPADLAVEETLKGSTAPRLVVPLGESERNLSRWRDAGVLLLVAIPRNEKTPAVVIDLGAPNLAVLTADLAVLRSQTAVIRAVREVIRQGPSDAGDSAGFSLSVPHALIAGTTLMSGVTNVDVRVPIDARLERRALAILRGEQEGWRLQAVDALRHFRSDSNVRVLTALLADTTLSIRETAENNRGHEIFVYDIRQRAYEILKSWGVAPPEPILRVETYKPELVESVYPRFFKRPITLEQFKDLRAFPNLWRLVLMSAQLPAGAYQEIAALTGLRELDLGYSNVTDRDLEVLASLEKLEVLHLPGTKITDAGLASIARFRALKTVLLYPTPVTARGRAELRSRRPDLAIR